MSTGSVMVRSIVRPNDSAGARSLGIPARFVLATAGSSTAMYGLAVGAGDGSL